jgi:hypothetical protein
LPADDDPHGGDPSDTEPTAGISRPPDPPLDPIDPIDALVHIRTLVEATADLTYGTKAESAIREIMKILDKALPPRGRERSPKP